MKPFEEMTKAEKMKVLEEDYLERKKQKDLKSKQKEQRAKRLKTDEAKETITDHLDTAVQVAVAHIKRL